MRNKFRKRRAETKVNFGEETFEALLNLLKANEQ